MVFHTDYEDKIASWGAISYDMFPQEIHDICCWLSLLWSKIERKIPPLREDSSRSESRAQMFLMIHLKMLKNLYMKHH